MVRKHIYFTGRVQGVGFRFHCQAYASELGLTGWCKNLHDGRVEAEVQGELSQIQDFIFKLRTTPWVEIERTQITDIPISKNEKSFRIQYY